MTLRSYATHAGKRFAEMGWSTVERAVGLPMRPIAVVQAALFLVSDTSSFVNDAPLIVDGELLARLESGGGPWDFTRGSPAFFLMCSSCR